MSKCKRKENKKLSEVIDNEKNFNFRPYIFTPRGIVELGFYAEDGGALSLMSREEVPMKVLFWLALLSPPMELFISEVLEGIDC